MEKIYDIMTLLSKTPSSNSKKEIIKDNMDNDLFMKSLYFLLNPYIVTGISSKKLKKAIQTKDTNIATLSSLEELMSYLQKNNTGRDVDILTVRSFADSQSDKLKNFVEKMVTKTLKIGVSEKTVNELCGYNFIPTFSVMLAESYEKKSKHIDGEFFVTLKLNGNRCIAIKKSDDDVKFYTRKGLEIEGLNQLKEEFKKLANGIVYDGEIILTDEGSQKSIELFTKTQKEMRKKGEKKNLEFYIFDMVTISEFEAGKSNNVYSVRRKALEIIDDTIKNEDLKFVKVLPTLYRGRDKSMILKCMNEAVKDDFEGIMVNKADGLYQTKRVVDLLKVKEFKTADIVCLGVEEGEGKYAGVLGNILVEYKGGVTRVGSGFSDKQRQEFWEDKDLIVGKIVEVSYFEETKNEKTKQKSIQFPVFKAIRNDKTIDDISYE